MVCGQGLFAEGHFITPECYLVVSEVTEGLNGNGCLYWGGTSYPNQWKIPAYFLRASSDIFEYGTVVV